jgi:hypothetical protein
MNKIVYFIFVYLHVILMLLEICIDGVMVSVLPLSAVS